MDERALQGNPDGIAELMGKRILLVEPFRQDYLRSMILYSAWLRKTLVAHGCQVETIMPASFFARLRGRGAVGKYLGYLDKFLLFPLRLLWTARRYELVHVVDHGYAMYAHLLQHRRHLVTCHDVHAIRAARGEIAAAHTGWSGRLLQSWILSGLRAAQNIVCVSTQTAAELQQLIAQPSARISMIPNPLNREFRAGVEMSEGLRQKLGLLPGQRYFVHLGGSSWYKNRPMVLRILARLLQKTEFAGMRLVLGGKPLNDAEWQLIRDLGIQSNCIESPHVPDEELNGLYGQAEALLFPSLSEGFGWPIIEAQACGCPVITSNRSPMKEVAGGAAILIDPEDADAAAEEIARQWKRRDDLRRAGLENSHNFDSERIAERYAQFYAAILRRDFPVRAKAGPGREVACRRFFA